MNFNTHEFFLDVNIWIDKNNQVAQEKGFNTDGYWQWVFASAGDIVAKYGKHPIAETIMKGLLDYLMGLVGE